MSIRLHGEPEPVGTKENPAIASFPIRNKKTGDIYYARGNAVTWHHPMAKSVNITFGGGVAGAINRRVAATGVGMAIFGGKGTTWTSLGGLSSFYLLREPGTMTLTVVTFNDEELTMKAHWRPPTADEMTAAFDEGRLNADLVELVTREDEAKAWDKDNKDVPEPEEDSETHLLAIEDAVEKLRARM